MYSVGSLICTTPKLFINSKRVRRAELLSCVSPDHKEDLSKELSKHVEQLGVLPASTPAPGERKLRPGPGEPQIPGGLPGGGASSTGRRDPAPAGATAPLTPRLPSPLAPPGVTSPGERPMEARLTGRRRRRLLPKGK